MRFISPLGAPSRTDDAPCPRQTSRGIRSPPAMRARSPLAASVGGLFHPSLATALPTSSRIDLAARLHWLHHHGVASAIACRTFRIARLRVRLNTRSPLNFSVPQF